VTIPAWNHKYGYRGRSEYELRPGGAHKAYGSEAMKACGGLDVIVDGEVIDSDPPRRSEAGSARPVAAGASSSAISRRCSKPERGSKAERLGAGCRDLGRGPRAGRHFTARTGFPHDSRRPVFLS
jgi:hypothetical protein